MIFPYSLLITFSFLVVVRLNIFGRIILSEKEVKDFKEMLDIHVENGLFKECENQRLLEEIYTILDNSNDPHRVTKALDKFRKAVQKAGRYRLVYIWGLPHLFYLLVIFFVVVFFSFKYGEHSILNIPLWCLTLGALGGIAQALWWLWFQVDRSRVRYVWWAWFISAPYIGSIFGLIAYLAFFAGFIVSTGSNVIAIDIFPKLLTILAGYSWRWMTKLIERITETLAPTSSHEAKVAGSGHQ